LKYMFEAKSEAFYKSGLAKSAFHDSVYESLPLDYYLPFITSTQRTFFNMSKYFHVKFYQAHDAFLMHYKPFTTVFQSLRKSNKIAPLWRLVIERTLKNQKFLDLNKITAGSSELSIVASVSFLLNLFRWINIDKLQQRYGDVLQQPQASQQGAQTLNEFMKGQNTQAQQQQPQQSASQQRFTELVKTVDEAVGDAAKKALNLAVEYKESVEGYEEDAVVLGGAGGSGFVKEALSVIKFLSTPEWFRERVKILRYARQFYLKFLTAVPTSLTHQQVVSVYGGINGVTRMLSEQIQIPDILSSELALAQLGDAGKALLALKTAQKQLMVYQRSASVKPVVFMDKSGSMAGSLTTWKGEEIAPKISIASGLALALHRKLNADIYLFDTEVEKVNPARIVDILLTVSADGGTDIDPVLEEIVRLGKQEYIYIIISDGITEASDEVLKKFEESGLAKRTKLILVPPSSYGYDWVELLKKYGNMMYVHNVAEFDEAVRKSLNT
jgi:uncharacterized protein with von Willebrand factor type A (vWA) domain